MLSFSLTLLLIVLSACVALCRPLLRVLLQRYAPTREPVMFPMMTSRFLPSNGRTLQARCSVGALTTSSLLCLAPANPGGPEALLVWPVLLVLPVLLDN